MASRVIGLLAAGAVLIAGAAGLAAHFARIDPVPLSVAAPRPLAVPAIKPAFSRRELQRFLDDAHKAEAISDPLQRCLAYPNPPGVNWSAETTSAYCHYLLDPRISFTEARDLIEHGRTAELQDRLAELEKAGRADPRVGDRLDSVYNIVFSGGTSDMRALMDAWKRQSPDNAFALAASGTAYVAMAQARRGSDYAKDTPQESFDAMHRLLEQARTDLDRAATLDPGLIVSYTQMLHVARMDSDPAYANSAAKRGFAAAPASYALYARLITMSQPKWGGSVALMDQLVSLSQKHVAQNALLATLRSERGGGQQRVEDCVCDEDVEAEQYRQVFAEVPTLGVLMSGAVGASERGHADLSLVYRSELLRFDPDRIGHRQARILELIRAGQTDWAIDEGNMVVALAPEDESSYEMRGLAYKAKGDMDRASRDFTEEVRLRKAEGSHRPAQ